MKKQGLHIFERFPDQSHLLTYHMAVDPGFYDLCQDYELCVQALKYWTASNDPNANARLDEYRSLTRELERDIINEMKSLSRKQ
jgi:uncharacterized protein Usg